MPKGADIAPRPPAGCRRARPAPTEGNDDSMQVGMAVFKTNVYGASSNETASTPISDIKIKQCGGEKKMGYRLGLDPWVGRFTCPCVETGMS